jgi:hypothetical protein
MNSVEYEIINDVVKTMSEVTSDTQTDRGQFPTSLSTRYVHYLTDPDEINPSRPGTVYQIREVPGWTQANRSFYFLNLLAYTSPTSLTSLFAVL